jgi:hypothetical protein
VILTWSKFSHMVRKLSSSPRSTRGCRLLGVLFLVQQIYEIQLLFTHATRGASASRLTVVIEALLIIGASLLLYTGTWYYPSDSAEYRSLKRLALGLVCLAVAQFSQISANPFPFELTFRSFAATFFLFATGFFIRTPTKKDLV